MVWLRYLFISITPRFTVTRSGSTAKFPIYQIALFIIYISSPVGWDCRIHRLHLSRELRHPPTSILDYIY